MLKRAAIATMILALVAIGLIIADTTDAETTLTTTRDMTLTDPPVDDSSTSSTSTTEPWPDTTTTATTSPVPTTTLPPPPPVTQPPPPPPPVVEEVVEVSSYEYSYESPIPESYWDRMAICETGGNWQHFPYGTWTGGLGIYNQTWLGWGGGEFAPTAGQASREQQIIVANRIAADVGVTAWGCVSTVGYP
jgi:hypothetical protein